MKILYVHRTRGKAVEAVHINGIVDSLSQMNNDVSVLSVYGLGSRAESENRKKKTVYREVLEKIFDFISKKSPQFLFEILEVLYNVIIFIRMVRCCKDDRPDFIYSRYSLYQFAPTLYARLKKIPIILEINHTSFVKRVRPISFMKFAAHIENKIFNNSQALIFISNELLLSTKRNQKLKMPMFCIPNAANTELFNAQIKIMPPLPLEKKLRDKIVCGYVGSFTEWHGIHWFITEASAELKKLNNVVIMLVGNGLMYPYIQDYVIRNGLVDKVILTGSVNHTDVPNLISLMNYSVLPDSNNYGSPVKLFETMAMGVGVIAPDYPPIKEIIDDNKTGWLFPAGDKNACLKRFIDVTNNKVMQVAVGECAKHYIAKNRTWHHNAKQVINVYNEVKYVN